MNSIKSALRIIEHINFILTTKQKRETIIVFFSMILCSLMELLGVSSIYPFLQLLLDEDSINDKWYLSWMIKLNPNFSSINIIIFMGAAIAVIFLVKNAIAIYCNYLQARYAARINRQLSTRILDSYMRRPYEFFVNTNSSILLRGLNGDVSAVYNSITNCFQIFAEFFSIILIVIYLIRVDYFVASMSISIAIMCFFAVTFGFKGLMKRTGKAFRVLQAKMSASSYQSIMGIKEIIVLNRREAYVKKYDQIAEEMEKCATINGCVGAVPDRLLEGVCISGIMGVLCVRIASGVDIGAFIPTLGAFVMGVFRIMPSISKVSTRINNLVFFSSGLDNTYQTLKEAAEIEKQNIEKEKILKSQLESLDMDSCEFNNILVLENVCWKYAGNRDYTLKGIDLQIKKGESVAFIGTSGGGKSTLADVIMTLFEPQSGSIKMDGIDIFLLKERWLKNIGYVPQSIFLVDDTVRANIAFGLPEEMISDERVWKSLEQAQIKEFVQKLPQGLDTIVGENGVKFSGGQRQRVAIARALYNGPEILIMDEATAALDNETEAALMDSIEELHGKKTLIIIAHRLTTIRKCDKVYEIKNGIAIERSIESCLNQ